MNSAPVTETASVKSRILVVDDISKNLQVVGTTLRNEGYEVMPAGSGAQALERVRVRLPDLILLDLMMPEMDGIEVCRRLKADPATAGLPIIFLTASNEMDHLMKCFEAGAVDYITKPFNTPELLARVRTHLELKHARGRLREMNDEKNEFMGMVAHDLRNPLATINSFSELIVEDARGLRRNDADAGTALQEIEDFGARIGATTARMIQMVQNLLDANRIERGEMKLTMAPTDLVSVVTSVTDAQRPRAEAKQQTIHLEIPASPLSVMVDPDITVQVLENLISNAVKYSPPGKNIFVRLKESPEGIRCEIQDEGPGIGEADQKKLFGKFARLSAKPTGGEHATGLGLSIVKRLVEAMYGQVWCESELGQGATFIVRLPPEPGKI